MLEVLPSSNNSSCDNDDNNNSSSSNSIASTPRAAASSSSLSALGVTSRKRAHPQSTATAVSVAANTTAATSAPTYASTSSSGSTISSATLTTATTTVSVNNSSSSNSTTLTIETAKIATTTPNGSSTIAADRTIALNNKNNSSSGNKFSFPSIDTTTGIGCKRLKQQKAVCMACGQNIFDPFILRVAPDLEYHSSCLKCAECGQFLDETWSCYLRDGVPYCKRDYQRLFGMKCSKCQRLLNKVDLVLRARDNVYHVNCFHCVICYKPLQTGDEFVMRDDGLFCKADADLIERNSLNTSMDSCGSHESFLSYSPPMCHNIPLSPGTVPSVHANIPLHMSSSVISNNNNSFPKMHSSNQLSQLTPLLPSDRPMGGMMTFGQAGLELNLANSHSLLNSNNQCINSPVSSIGSESGNSGGDGRSSSNDGLSSSNCSKKSKKHKDQKTTRVRTVLNEKQLHTLRTCYNANPRPDALMKEQLVEMTGLSPRVIRVWFQNKRCKDKKKTILIKQLQQQHDKNQVLSNMRMQSMGPMITTPPIRHDMSHMIGQQPIEVSQHRFHPGPPIGPQQMLLPQPPTASIHPPALQSGWKHNSEFAPPPLHQHTELISGNTAGPIGGAFQHLMNGFADGSIEPARAPMSFQLHDAHSMPNGSGRNGLLGSVVLSPMAHSDLSSPSCSD